MRPSLFVLLAAACSAALCSAQPLQRPPVFPLPQEITLADSTFKLTEEVVILLPSNPSKGDLALANGLKAHLADHVGLAMETLRADAIPTNRRVILMGSVANTLVQKTAAARGWKVTSSAPGPEGYQLSVTPQAVLVAGCDDAGAFYGLQSLRQLISGRITSGAQIRGAEIRDWPLLPFRAVRLYLPGHENIAFFKRFLRDFLALYKFNRVILEMNAGMRFDRHPELNAGWADFAKDLDYSRRERPLGPNNYFTDSSHQDTADGGTLEKTEVADLVATARELHMDVIPEIPSLTHSYYLLTRHRELAEIQDAEWPDTYCPADPRSYALIFDVLDEYVEVMKPRMVNIGHDEWRMPTGLCERCKGQDVRDLLVQDINKLHAHLAKQGVKTAMWGDHFLENLRGRHLKHQKSSSGYEYDMPGALTPEQVRDSIPKDIVVLNWFWNGRDAVQKHADDAPPSGPHNDQRLSDWGFQQVWGNLTPELSWQNYVNRSRLKGVLGGASSSWAATTEFNLGKDLMWRILGTQNMLWSSTWPQRADLTMLVQSLMPEVRRFLSGTVPPSDDGDRVVPVDVTALQTAEKLPMLEGFDPASLKAGTVNVGRATLQLSDTQANAGKFAVVVSNRGADQPPYPMQSDAIAIGKDVSSLIFLHALAKPAGNQTAYRLIHNFPDSADLLGWYEVVYADGLTVNVPIRYGVNILEWDWARRTVEGETYCYGADAVNIGGQQDNPVTFYAYEWRNPRFGKIIKEIRLKGSNEFLNSKPFPAPPWEGKPIATNAIMLRAVSAVEARGFPEPVRATNYKDQKAW